MSVNLITLEKKSNPKTLKEKIPRINNTSINKNSMFCKNIQFGDKPSIQRKPMCPCGGGCPGCQTNNKSIQAKLKVSQPNDPAYNSTSCRLAYD